MLIRDSRAVYQIDYHANAIGSGDNMESFLNDIELGENFTLEEFVQIVRQSQTETYWFGPTVQIPLIAAYMLIMMFGLFANGLICYIVIQKKKLQTVRNMFITNLAVSDMIMCVFCMPFTLMKLLLKNWSLGEAMCKIVPWLQAVNVFASIVTITAIALDRYQVIVYPTHLADNKRKWATGSIIAAIWVASALSGLPLLIYSKVQTNGDAFYVRQSICLEKWPSEESRIAYAATVLILQFLIPIVLLITIHWRISSFLKGRIAQNPTTHAELSRAMKEASRHRKNSTLLMSIAVMFALCWFPLTLLNFLADFNHKLFMFQNFLLAFAVAHILAMISACLNPIMYGWFNTNFRTEFTNVVCFWRKSKSELSSEKQLLCDQKINYPKPFSYKAIQTDVQPVFKQYTLSTGDIHLRGSSESSPGQR